MLKPSHRLRGRREPRIVLKHGKAVREGWLMLKFLQRGNENYRLTVAVNKKVAKSAPLRNAIRRRIYETIRKELKIKKGFYVVILGHSQELATMPQKDLERDLVKLFKKANLLEQ